MSKIAMECEKKLIDVFYNNIGAEDFKDRCLQIIGETLDVTHINLFECDCKINSTSNIFGRLNIEGSFQKDVLKDVSINIILWWLKRIKANQVLIFKEIDEISNSKVKSFLSAEGIKSIAVVPQFHKKTFYGFIGVGESRLCRDWRTEEVDVLKFAAKIIHIANVYTHTKNLLSKSEELLKEQKLVLDCKNVALREMLTQMEYEKQRIKENLQTNVDQLIIPGLEKLGNGNASSDQINILKSNLQELTEPYPVRATSRINLSPRETEVCNMIKKGLSNKEIAENLCITLRTIETHRNNIRKKLEIANQDINLAVYLQSQAR